VDFEFTQLGKNNLILISGAVLDRFQPGFVTKLEGRALKLETKEPVNRIDWKAMVQHLVNIFKTKPKTLFPILAQIYDSDHTLRPNFTFTAIKNMLDKYDAIVMWEGSTDHKILNKLEIYGYMLTMRGWDVHNDNQFDLQLIDISTKRTIISIQLGHFSKQGRALKLSEAHKLVCEGDHGATEALDPKTDVLWTRCLFNKLRREYRDLIDESIYT